MIARLIWPDEADGWLLDPVAGPVWVRRVLVDCTHLGDEVASFTEGYSPIGAAPQIPGAEPWALMTRNAVDVQTGERPESGIITSTWSLPPGWPVGVDSELRAWILQRMRDREGGTP